MNIGNFVWQKVRRIGKVPGMYSLFYTATNTVYKDGSVTTFRFGPVAGLRWCHYRSYQPWMALGFYEPSVADLIYKTLQPGDVFYDVGANAGYFTLIAAKAVGPTGQVVAFDPVPQNVETILTQIKLNKLSHICQVEPLAVADIEETVQFQITARNANAHLAEVEAPHVSDSRGEIIDVRCTTLNGYVATHTPPTLIKMDIEGAEVKALMGATQLLRSPNAPVFLVTAHSEILAKQVKEIFHKAGYRFTNFRHMIHAIPATLVDQYSANYKYSLV